MAITFHPEPRMVLVCDFTTGFKEPEMVKVRPVIVLSPQRNNRETCIVVPLSTVEPDPIQGFRHRLDPGSLPQRFRNEVSWVKGDMVTTVALHRLDRVRSGKNKAGTRLYVAHKVMEIDWAATQHAVAIALGLGNRLI
jgi:mRNA interferase MazF